MEEEMRGKKEQERREEAEREKVMGLDINQDGGICQVMMVMEDGGQEQGGKKEEGEWEKVLDIHWDGQGCDLIISVSEFKDLGCDRTLRALFAG